MGARMSKQDRYYASREKAFELIEADLKRLHVSGGRRAAARAAGACTAAGACSGRMQRARAAALAAAHAPLQPAPQLHRVTTRTRSRLAALFLLSAMLTAPTPPRTQTGARVAARKAAQLPSLLSALLTASDPSSPHTQERVSQRAKRRSRLPATFSIPCSHPHPQERVSQRAKRRSRLSFWTTGLVFAACALACYLVYQVRPAAGCIGVVAVRLPAVLCQIKRARTSPPARLSPHTGQQRCSACSEHFQRVAGAPSPPPPHTH